MAEHEHQEVRSLTSGEQAMSTQAAPNRLSRRTFLRAALASAGVLAVGGTMAPLVMGAPTAAGGGTTTRYPLRIPPGASPYNNFALTAAPGTANLGTNTSNVLAYNSSFPGPTFRATRGNTASIQFTNKLSEATTVHWHGMIVPTAADGQPQDLVAPGKTY